MEKIINGLQEAIQKLGMEAVLAPQTASANRPRIELYFTGIEPAGIDSRKAESGNLGWERITFTAQFRSDGTHSRWVTDTILARRKLLPFEESPMPLTVSADKPRRLAAHWKRLTPGRFEYPDEEQSSMPARYVESWEITVAYPAHIIG